MSLRKSTVILLVFCLLSGLTACRGKTKQAKVNDTKWHSEKLTAPGDVFNIPEIKTTDGAPVIGELSKQVNPGNTITVTGEGFTGAKAYVYSQSEKDNGRANEAQVSFVDDSNAAVTVDSSIKYGAYGIYFENSKGKSEIEIINKPLIWWIGLTHLAAGDDINVYGENLTTDNAEGTDKTYGYLVSKDGKYRELNVKYADPYKVTFTMPDGLIDGEEYEIKLHNGHGGDSCFATAPEKVKFSKNKVNNFTGKKINVKDYGADPADNGKDDTAAVQKAVASANKGDIIYFPEGVYLLNGSIEVSTSVSFLGEGSKSVILNGRSDKLNKKAVFELKADPCKFQSLYFKDVRKDNFINSFISIENLYNGGGNSLCVTDCRFLQASEKRSSIACIVAANSDGIIINSNSFEATKLIWVNGCNKIIITDNDFCGNNKTGQYYDQNGTLIWDSYKLDCSGNKFYGKDLLTDPDGTLSLKDDCTVGRTFAIQGFVYDFYISKNTMMRTGLPNDNAGEQIMLENIFNRYNDTIIAADNQNIQIKKSIQLSKNFEVAVVSGKGMGQVRYVKGYKGSTVTVDKEWNIIPDSTSRILISASFHNFAIYNNSIDGFKTYNQSYTATSGVQVYGNTFNCYITKNVMKNMASGVSFTSHYILNQRDTDMDDKKTYAQNVVYWAYFDDNSVSNVTCGVWVTLAALRVDDLTDELPLHSSVGIIIRNNSFTNITEHGEGYNRRGQGLGGIGILIGTARKELGGYPNTEWDGAWEYGTVIENCKFENCELVNISLCKNQRGTVLISNSDSSSKHDVYTVDTGGAEPQIYK